MSIYVSFKCDKCEDDADFEIEELYDKRLKSFDLIFEFPRDWEIRDDKMLCETCQDYDEANENE